MAGEGGVGVDVPTTVISIYWDGIFNKAGPPPSAQEVYDTIWNDPVALEATRTYLWEEVLPRISRPGYRAKAKGNQKRWVRSLGQGVDAQLARLAENAEVDDDYSDYSDDELLEQQYEFESDAEPGSEEAARIQIENVAPYAVGPRIGTANQFQETGQGKKPRNLPDPPDRLPRGRMAGRLGTAVVIVEGIKALINWGKDYFEDGKPLSKGPPTRPKAKQKQETAPDEIRVEIERRLEPVVTAPVATTSRAEERRREEIGKIKEITVTKQRRALPGPPGKATPLPPLPKVRKPFVLDPLRVYDLISRPRGRGTKPDKTRETDRTRREQISLSPNQQNPRAETKERTKCEESRARCYKGFYRERNNSTTKKKWTEIDCLTGKEINRG